MKKTFRFEVQNFISVDIKADTRQEARMILINNLEDYGDQMCDGLAYVSDGEEIKQ